MNNAQTKKSIELVMTELNKMTAVLGIVFDGRFITKFFDTNNCFYIEGKFSDGTFCLMQIECLGAEVSAGVIEFNDRDELLIPLSHNAVIRTNLLSICESISA